MIVVQPKANVCEDQLELEAGHENEDATNEEATNEEATKEASDSIVQQDPDPLSESECEIDLNASQKLLLATLKSQDSGPVTSIYPNRAFSVVNE